MGEDRARRDIGDGLFLLSAVPMGVPGVVSHETRGQIQPREVHGFIVLAIEHRTDAFSRNGPPAKTPSPARDEGWRLGFSSPSPTVNVSTPSSDRAAFIPSTWQGTYSDEGVSARKEDVCDVGELGSSPVLYGSRFVIAWDHQGASFVVALDAGPARALARDRQKSIHGARLSWWSTPAALES